jgi:hypothetical protein
MLPKEKERQEPAPTSVLPGNGTAPAAHSADASSGLVTVKEMLAGMAVQTVAGQRYTMAKVVGFLQGQIAVTAVRASSRNKREVSRLIHQLAREAERPLPNSRYFSDRAHRLVALLIATLECPQP